MITRSKNNRRRGHRSGVPACHVKLTCSFCREPIKEVLSALASPTDGTAVHFDCAIKVVEEILKPRKGERVIYHGHGCFAVVNNHVFSQKKIQFLRSINWENLEKAVEWRNKLRHSML